MVNLECELQEMASRTKVLEDTHEKVSKFVVDLSKYVSKIVGPGASTPVGGIPPEEYRTFKASQEHAIASICQELKGGGISLGGFAFDGKDACIAFAREHLSAEHTYHCIPSLMFALCMPSNKVVYKSNMQGDEIHAARMARNPMQLAVVIEGR